MEFSKIYELERPFSAWPWRINDKAGLLQLVTSLSRETHEAMLAIYLSIGLDLLAIDVVGKGSVSEVQVNFGDILCRGRLIRAAGFVLVHNHPSGSAKPSELDIEFTQRLRSISKELDLPLLDHFVVAGSQIERIGDWL